MAYEQLDGTGALFSNKSKPKDAEPGKGKPDVTGSITISGVKCELAGWTKTPKKGGARFLSLTIEIPAGYRLVQVGESETPASSNGSPSTPSSPPKENVAF